MTIIKRDRKSTSHDLVQAIERLCWLLEDQKEEEAVQDLRAAAAELEKSEAGSASQKAAVEKIIDAFEGDHELMAYTHQREGSQWTEVEELSSASSRVLSLARRMMR
ncbi:MAG: hypothetical protein ACOH5I_05240 [Oligoflexus sp.]